MKNKSRDGFTLIEILVVIGIIAVLAAIVIVAINPGKQFAQARNTERTSNVESILNAIGQRIADNKGIFAGDFGSSAYHCGALPTATTTISNENLVTAGALGCLVPTYISELPRDPSWISSDAATTTFYTVTTDATTGRVTICAPRAGNETAIPDAASICLTR